jgi:hypothetical protein
MVPRADLGTTRQAVFPAQAGIHLDSHGMFAKAKWVPACAGMTAREKESGFPLFL